MAKKRFTLRIDEELDKKLKEAKWKKRKSKNSLNEIRKIIRIYYSLCSELLEKEENK